MSVKNKISWIAALGLLVSATGPLLAGQKKTPGKGKSHSSDDFKLTLSSVPYSANPEDSFVRQACKTGKAAKKQSKKTK